MGSRDGPPAPQGSTATDLTLAPALYGSHADNPADLTEARALQRWARSHASRRESSVHVCGGTMISVTRLKGQVVALNPDLIESVEENPDTTVRLISGEKLLVRESLVEVVQLVAEYRRYILSALSVQPLSGSIGLSPSQRPPAPNGASKG